ncbi:hypothetical protein FRX94_06695 [Corynebacterium canis]|uniref:Uncharacterized protein n=1 Tax=Corynebacterium canis TaxID=679663 RepID=A0A5C5UIP7_9CORY|nr:hypothetical protein [Corynebacterium canis]TWT25492.1 hypothetical protein FRX94_06695 [Corynebacterium canis]WJY76180.1 hypothetical protein CCANI_11865 [Corynebacterium canis]
MNTIPVANSPLRHTYPFGQHDVELTYGTADELRTDTAAIFAAEPRCRRVVVAVPEGDLEAIAECESAGYRYVLDVQLRDGKEVSLMVNEPEWVTSKDKEEVELS